MLPSCYPAAVFRLCTPEKSPTSSALLTGGTKHTMRVANKGSCADPSAEYEEMRLKARALVAAIEQTSQPQTQ